MTRRTWIWARTTRRGPLTPRWSSAPTPPIRALLDVESPSPRTSPRAPTAAARGAAAQPPRTASPRRSHATPSVGRIGSIGRAGTSGNRPPSTGVR